MQARESIRLLVNIFVDILRALDEIFWNFIRNVIDHYDYVGKDWKQSKNVYRNYEIVIEDVYLVKN